MLWKVIVPNSKEILSTIGNIASPPPFFFHTEGKKRGGGNLKLPVLRPTTCGIEFQLIEIKNIYTESNGMYRQAIYIDWLWNMNYMYTNNLNY